MMVSVRQVLGSVLLVTALAPGAVISEESAPQLPEPPSVILITLDTTRADHVGAYLDRPEITPNINRVAREGIRYQRALTPAPLTLPAHATILTGLDPPEHGVRDNGRGSLPVGIPTLATELAAGGYSTAAFVASRVLDHRFGLDRGFNLYDDHMAAEKVGEYGYAERDARAVTDAALSWLLGQDPGTPTFIWVHYYDPHAPYLPPDKWRQQTARGDYAGEIAFMDQEIARLLAALPGSPARRIIAIVGDHGESLGEHGERTHGIFLYRAALEVPLILAGAGLPAARTVPGVVGLRQLAPTLLRLAGYPAPARRMAPILPGIEKPLDEDPQSWAYSESRMQATVYGWAPLESLTTNRWKLINGPRPELYDLKTDPGETLNLIGSRPAEAQAMREALTDAQHRMSIRRANPVTLDQELVEALEVLGYLQGAAQENPDGIDPRDGLRLLAELDRAKEAERRGAHAAAVTMLRSLSKRNPTNLPVLSHLAVNLLATGQSEQAIATYRRALALNPESELLWLGLGKARRTIGQAEAAAAAFKKALEIDLRSATAWLGLADLSSDTNQERAVLNEAVAAGVDSTILLVRLAQIELETGESKRSEELLARACELTPDWAPVWMLRGDVADARRKPQEALAWYRRSLQLQPDDNAVLLRLGQVYLRLGETENARRALRRAATAAGSSPTGQRAIEALQSIDKDGSAVSKAGAESR